MFYIVTIQKISSNGDVYKGICCIVDSCWSAGMTHISLRQQFGTELHVIFQVERSAGLELGSESRYRGGLAQFLHASYTTKLFLGVLGD